MEGIDPKNSSGQTATSIADPLLSTNHAGTTHNHSIGSDPEEAALEKALIQSLAPDEHDHAPPVNNRPELHISLDQVDGAKTLDPKKIGRDTSLKDNLGRKGDILNGRGGDNVIIGSGDSDIIRAAGGGFNTITTGTGRDTVILGRETTNRIFDFDPTNDRLLLGGGLNPKNIVIAQGKNPGKGGLDQPLDATSNTLVIDKKTGHILAALTFVKASDITEKNFARLTPEANRSIQGKELGLKTQRGNGQLTGTNGRDRLIGGDGNDFLYVGDGGFKFNTATGGGGTEFPFPTTSPGSSEMKVQLKGGVLQLDGTYKNFDGFPLFSQGEKTIDPNATILNGSNPQALVEGFLRVPKDVEGNPISGTHVHFSPAGDSRGNFADATVVRFLENTPTDAKSGTLKGEFELTPAEQAALLAGNFYINIHTNLDGDGDGIAGYPTGENRINLNRNVVSFT
ncbi:MAG TPA: CHRD domain-containing protein [Leptolyngbyaceae cyanobacterium M33_DOE_097]|uniref:CHRD domain-containing protein n=1 Tax=Oscillatoriales cyanobacterium SpSt-418 TaxID=2282169 RepID=A0A7C3PHC7_9CYAN|nr:CHRD domain-containing protein [Leptolyngbyaceae cyanobacterium M33_DOE_097]